MCENVHSPTGLLNAPAYVMSYAAVCHITDEMDQDFIHFWQVPCGVYYTLQQVAPPVFSVILDMCVCSTACQYPVPFVNEPYAATTRTVQHLSYRSESAPIYILLLPLIKRLSGTKLITDGKSIIKAVSHVA